jgi:hypothetical protein
MAHLPSSRVLYTTDVRPGEEDWYGIVLPKADS